MRPLLLALALLAGCGSSDSTEPLFNGGGAGAGGEAGAGGSGSGGAAGGVLPCPELNLTRECVGVGACKGGQVCSADGWTPCACGEGGSAGGAGTGASSGAGGSPQGQGGGGSGPGGSGAGGGASGQQGAGAGGSACVPVTKDQACAANQCATVSDGCGGQIACASCPAWAVCTAGAGVATCEGRCKPSANIPGDSSCASQGSTGLTQLVICPDDLPGDQYPSKFGCTGASGSMLGFCCPPAP